MEEDIIEESGKDITSKWLDLIFESLRRLQEHEKLMREGCLSVYEYITLLQLPIARLNDIKIKNMGLMITEFDILLGNIQSIIPDKVYKELKEKLDEQNNIFPKTYQIGRNELKGSQSTILKEEFFVIQSELIKMRTKIISNLQHILHSKKDKSKQKEV